VSHVPPDITKDELELLFESDSFCPGGGDVECVEVDEDTRTAVITLEDECGTCINCCFDPGLCPVQFRNAVNIHCKCIVSYCPI